MAEDRDAERVVRTGAIIAAEQRVAAAVEEAFEMLAAYAAEALSQSGYDTSVLDARWPEWTRIVEEVIDPAVAEAWATGYASTERTLTAAPPALSASRGATAHLAAVHNRMVGTAEDVFDTIRGELDAGRVDGEDIPTLSKRVDDVLASTGTANWQQRAVTVARTEVIAANNAGASAAAHDVADALGHGARDVAKEWLATADARTRETHAAADGQIVMGLDTPFDVGGSMLAQPGDPSGPPEEVINCRCTVVFHYPGDPGYPDASVTAPDPKAAAAPYAQGLIDAATKVEPGITSTMKGLTAEMGGHMEGLDFRVKGVDSLTDKIADKVALGASPASAAASISDAVRYTAVYPEAAYAAGAENMVARLSREGYTVRVKNYWGHETNPYRGINLALDKGGQKVELQVHTPASFAKKQGRMHTLYEQARYAKDPAEVARLNTAMWDEMSDLSAPRGAELVGRRRYAYTDRVPLRGEQAHDHHLRGSDRTRPAAVADRGTRDPRTVGRVAGTVGHRRGGIPEAVGLQSPRVVRTDRGAGPEHRPGRVLTAAADDDLGVCLVALPAADDPVQSIGEEEKHATLLWFGTPSENPALDQGLISQAAGAAAAATAPFASTVAGVETLGDDGARVWMIGDQTLTDLRAAVINAEPLIQTMLDAVEQHPSFTPHTTIGYPPEGETLLDPATEDAAAAVESITYDRLALWAGEDHTAVWPFGTANEEDAVMPWTKVQDHPDCATDSPWGVVNEETDELMGCHATEEDADAQIAALEANVEEEEAAAGRTTTYAESPPARADDIPPDGEPWYGILAPEGVVSGDGREFAPESLTWRDLPLPLMYQEATAIGHDGAVRVGRIDTITRDGNMIRGAGVWDTSEVAAEARRQIETRILRGVSVEADDYVSEIVDENGDPLDIEMLFFADDVDLSKIIEVATAARIVGATLVSVPAFHQSYVANGVRDPAAPEPGMNDLGEPVIPNAPEEVIEVPLDEPVPASAWTLVASALAPVAVRHFADPHLAGPTALTIEPDGHIYGHLALWGTCHIGHDGTCVVPPHSNSGYLYFATGLVDTDAGPVGVGQITMDTGHADASLRWRPAAAHYDNTGSAVADVAVGEDEHGIWYSGLMRPGVTEAQVRDLKASGALSGDWRDTGGADLELVAALAVNVGGFPVPRLQIAASGGRQTALLASGIVGPEVMAHRTVDADPRAVARLVIAALDRRDKVARLKRRIGRDKASRVAAATRIIRGA
jgi:2'-5' RNA ligase/lambda repressor-like predicted transcriptional regulator